MDQVMETLTRIVINFVQSLQALTDTAHNNVIMNAPTYGTWHINESIDE